MSKSNEWLRPNPAFHHVCCYIVTIVTVFVIASPFIIDVLSRSFRNDILYSVDTEIGGNVIQWDADLLNWKAKTNVSSLSDAPALSQLYAFVYSGTGIPIKFLCRECDISTFYVGDTEAAAEREIIPFYKYIFLPPQICLEVYRLCGPGPLCASQLTAAPVCFNTSSLSSRTYDVP